MANIQPSIKDWSTTEASNQPDSTDSATIAGDLRAVQAGVRYIYTASTIASASTTDIGSVDAHTIAVSGTTTITALGTVSAGIRKILKFDGALTLTHSAGLLLPGAANITTAANDTAEFESLGSGNWRCNWYKKQTGKAVIETVSAVGAGITNTSGTISNDCIGKHTIWIPAGALTARTTSGASAGTAESTTNKVMIKTLDYDASTIEYSQCQIRFPKGWNEGTVTCYFLWSNASGTGDVVWAAQAVALSDDDAIDTAFGTAQSVTDSVTAAGDIMQSAETSAITIAGTPAAGDLVVFQFYRDASNGSDTLAVDARLHGVAIIYTTDAANDA